ncbi:hypothetical protein D3C73_750180 [compost metagenome]
MVNAEHLSLVKGVGHGVVDFEEALQVAADRLLQHDAIVLLGQAGRLHGCDDAAVERGRHRQKGDGVPFAGPGLQRAQALGVGGVHRQVVEPGGQARPAGLVPGVVGLGAGLHRLAHLGDVVLGRLLRSGGADDLEPLGQKAVMIQEVERRQKHPHGEVAAAAEQDQIRRLAGEFRIISRRPGQSRFDPLFADLLRGAFGALGDQARGPAVVGIGLGADMDGALQPADAAEPRRVLLAEAADAVQVAGVADRAHLHHHGVAVAVGRHRDDVEEIPRRLALAPPPPARAREEGRLSAVQRLTQRRLVHIGQGQHLQGVGVLHHGGDQAVSFGEVDGLKVEHHSNPLIPADAGIQ